MGHHRNGSSAKTVLTPNGPLPLDKNWNLFGKLGVTENHIKFSGSSRHTDLLVGAGIGYNATQNIGVRLECEDFGKLPNDANSISTKATNWDST